MEENVFVGQKQIAEVPDDTDASPLMPEIVVEVLSKGNTEVEIAGKRRLSLNEGAEQVWTCAENGTVRFFRGNGEREHSRASSRRFRVK
jgi:Uma2 family endonuclease